MRELIGERLALSVLLSIFAMIFTWIVAIPIGVYSATHQYSIGDRFFTFLSFVGMATPGVFIGPGPIGSCSFQV